MKPDVDVVEGSQVRVLVIFVVSSLRCGGGGLGGGRREEDTTTMGGKSEVRLRVANRREGEGLLKKISKLLAVLRYNVGRWAGGIHGRGSGGVTGKVYVHVHVEAGDTAEGAIAAAGALVAPSPQSCLRHRRRRAPDQVHSPATLACDRRRLQQYLCLHQHATRSIGHELMHESWE
jgi:hypothetical protein